MEGAVLRVERLSHRYTIQWAIRNISFEIPGKGIYGLLGSNGAGKSTTMNVISGVIKQTEGDVFIKGIDTRKDPVNAKRLIGFLPQKPPLYGDLTVEEYLIHCARLRWVPTDRIQVAVNNVLERCGIVHFRKRLIKNLSGGYQQRVGIAQAIVHEPDLVIFDEPTNGLDPNQIVEVRHLIKEIAEERTVILSTHILTEVQMICDSIMMIEEGHLVFMGTVDEFDNYIAPNSLFVSFVDAPTLEMLSKIGGVQKAENLGQGRFRIHFMDAQEATDTIVKASMENNWRLSEIRVEKSSLDNIFAELTKNHKNSEILCSR
ncbi:MAG: ABC transporter ATP-binding protein [Marinifilaceae bacterium]|nr:ABC transporter ATP-binding protein [Marinifilaceae bacterium]